MAAPRALRRDPFVLPSQNRTCFNSAMVDERLLSWSDLRRGLVTLAQKSPALLRASVSMALTSEDSPKSLAGVIQEHARRCGQRSAVKSADGDLSYAQLNGRANRTARLMRHHGVAPGDVVAVLMSNRPELLVTVLACAKIGAVASMINVNQRRDALTHSLACAPPVAVVVGEELLAAYLDVALDRPLLVVPDPRLSAANADRPPRAVDVTGARRSFASTNLETSSSVSFGDALFYVFTSGTTGMPKASIMSHRRWIGAGHLFGDVCLELGAGDTLYCPLPLYHNQALTTSWASAVMTCSALAIRRTFSASEFWSDCRRFGATAVTYIGEVARYLLATPPRPLDRDHRVTRAVGVGMRAELWGPFKERFGLDAIYEFYGASELNVGFFNLLNLDKTVGVCPGPWALVEFDVVTGEPVRDPRGKMRRLKAPGSQGLLLTEVTNRFKFEVYTDQAATEKKLFRDVFARGDCWVNSGDVMRQIGFGHLQFVDRVGDTFRWKGENVATGEVEAALNGVEGVADCAVYGVEVPGRSGRAGMAAIVWRGGERPDLMRLNEALSRALPAYAVPVFVRVVDALAVTGTFKHKKVDLKREGFYPGASDEPVFVREGGLYVRLTKARYAAIVAGEVRL